MNSGFADFSGAARARAAGVSPTAEAVGSAASWQPGADEGALMNILRLLNRVQRIAPLPPVERAFVLGAKVMFEQLAKACDELLTQPPPPREAPAPAADTLAAPTAMPQPTHSPEDAPSPGRRRSRRSPSGGLETGLA